MGGSAPLRIGLRTEEVVHNVWPQNLGSGIWNALRLSRNNERVPYIAELDLNFEEFREHLHLLEDAKPDLSNVRGEPLPTRKLTSSEVLLASRESALFSWRTYKEVAENLAKSSTWSSTFDELNQLAAFQHPASSKRIQVLSLATGLPGVNGGVNTAAALMLSALKSRDNVDVGLVIVDPDFDANSISSDFKKEFEFPIYSIFGKNFFELLAPKREKQTWIIGHGPWTGIHAVRLKDYWPNTKRIHVIHTDPRLISAARMGGSGEGERGLTKWNFERELIEKADIAVFVGRTSESYRRVIDKLTRRERHHRVCIWCEKINRKNESNSTSNSSRCSRTY